MKRWSNGLAALAAILVSLTISVVPGDATGHRAIVPRQLAASAAVVVVRDGERGLVDTTGQFVPVRDYRRILSGSSVIDGMLRELCEPTRILHYTGYSADPSRNPYFYHYAGKGAAHDLSRIEAAIAEEPDLVLLHNIGDPSRVARMRDAGLTVFDFGEMRGLSTLLPNLGALGALLGRTQHAASFARRFQRRMQNIAAQVPDSSRPMAMYVSIYGDQVYGGTAGTSYHDVLTAAGLRDVAAEQGYVNWPDFSPEQVVVTHDSMMEAVCGHPALRKLRACGDGGQVVGVPSGLVEAPGLPMLAAAEQLFELVHPTADGPAGRQRRAEAR